MRITSQAPLSTKCYPINSLGFGGATFSAVSLPIIDIELSAQPMQTVRPTRTHKLTHKRVTDSGELLRTTTRQNSAKNFEFKER
jgi:hypothetical protein